MKVESIVVILVLCVAGLVQQHAVARTAPDGFESFFEETKEIIDVSIAGERLPNL
uniref:hypothetical protein n=1 Tax=Vibrio alfacsensis TaxID=1074311 RepID=UPI0013E3C82A|nr:hypothetical protein [Vibrio alfacsensis]